MICLMRYVNNTTNCIKKYITDFPVLIIFQIISIILSVIILIIGKKIDFDKIIYKSISNELLNNFNDGYFLDFIKCQLPSENKDPSKSNNDNLISFGEWQGTKNGCGRIKGDIKKAEILKDGEKCDGEFLGKIPSQEIYSYKGITLCGITKGNYYDLLYDGSIVKKNANCPEGKKKCGFIDTIYNILCFDENKDCPISYIKIAKNEPKGIENLKMIEGNNITFFYSNNPYLDGTLPYIQNSFKIADSKICSLPNLYYSRINLFELDAYKNECSIDCQSKKYSQEFPFDDIRYHSLDLIDNYKLFQENRIISKIENSKLIEYGFNINTYKGHYLNIYVRTHFGFDIDCLNKINFKKEELNLIKEKADKMEIWGENLLFIISTMVGSFLDIFVFCKACKCIPVEIFIKYVFILGPSVSMFFYSKSAKRYDNSYEKEMTCSDPITNNNYNIMIRKIKNSGKNISLCFNLLIGLVCLNITTLLINIGYKIYKYKKKNKDQLSENKNNNNEEDEDEKDEKIPMIQLEDKKPKQKKEEKKEDYLENDMNSLNKTGDDFSSGNN